MKQEGPAQLNMDGEQNQGPAHFPISDGVEVMNLVPKSKENESAEHDPFELTDKEVEEAAKEFMVENVTKTYAWEDANTDIADPNARINQNEKPIRVEERPEDNDLAA